MEKTAVRTAYETVTKLSARVKHIARARNAIRSLFRSPTPVSFR